MCPFSIRYARRASFHSRGSRLYLESFVLVNAENLGRLAFKLSCSVFIGVKAGFKPVN